MSPRQVLAAITRRAAADQPDEIEQWVDGLRPTVPTGGLTALASTAPIDTAAVRALTDTREEQQR
ncbi:hypothetical protein [Micromonospora sp. HUAS LYJ1]|uniref:hypothetical protein n=1 Tax=Micromonospora sp. HUAS LYJ1 TaxID=3061626 RepID=UPI002671CAC9|nr:hypothetical protein [Micromonospora sp. HUAS LYJ1]WKU03724.1 hypothetical protein Q2K16_23210 [Micromonospora sp. HUAS LYJ1]